MQQSNSQHSPSISLRHQVVSLMVAILLSVSSGGAFAANSFLDTSIGDFQTRRGHEIYGLCRKLNTPCGIESDPANPVDKHQWHEIHLTSTTARAALDALVEHHGGYRWVLRDGVINIEPKERAGEDFLARKLDHVVLRDLSSLDAMMKVLYQANLQVSGIVNGDPRYADVTLELRNVTVRDALNAIAKADGQVSWIFNPGDGTPTGGGFSLDSWRKSEGKSLWQSSGKKTQ